MTPEKKADLENKWKALVTKAVTDDDFKKNLTQDTLVVLKDHGLEIPEEAVIRVLGGKEVRIKPPKDSTPEMDEEIKWWKMRLAMIFEFGKDDPRIGVIADAAPIDEEGEV